MSETATNKNSRWRNPFLEFAANLLFEGIFVVLIALGSLLAAWMFGFERWSNKAEVVGMALAMLFLIVVLVVAALVWAHRRQNTSRTDKPADVVGKQ